ncbi:MAG: hypothetical protein K5840_02140 [Eubacterium sp.]|nr:hypothetical protein [Eubacterium sp.]
MEKLQVVVCDHTAQYVCALVGYMSRKWPGRVEAAGFYDAGSAGEYCEAHGVDILLVGEEEFCMELAADDGRKVFVLCEDAGHPLVEGFACLDKYRPADETVRRILDEGSVREMPGDMHLQGAGLICVYSPGQIQEQTPFAVTLATVLGQDYRTLYVNLRENAGFARIFGREFKRDLSDLVYLTNRKSDMFRELVAQEICQDCGLVYLPPLENPSDIQQLGKKEWISFFERLTSQMGYEKVVVDLSGALPVFYDLLGQSEVTYVPTQMHPYGRAQLAQFEKRLEKMGYASINERIVRIRLPTVPGLYMAEDVMTGWTWGDMGDFVRELTSPVRMEAS